MFTLPETRFDCCSDEYIYAEISREMSPESNFKALVVTNELRRRNIPGILDICPSNASYLIRFDPEVISPYDLLEYLKEIDITKSNTEELNSRIRIVEIPTWYDDPITRELSFRFRDRNVDPTFESNLELIMKLNGFDSKEAFIEAHSSSAYLISMMGFIPGTAWKFPLGLNREEIIQTPKYASPRTYTKKQCIGLGGAFTVVYPVDSSGSYQLFARSAVPVYDDRGLLEDLKDSPFLARPGDIWKFRPIDEQEFYQIDQEVQQGTYRYKMKYVDFSPAEYIVKNKAYINQLMEGF